MEIMESNLPQNVPLPIQNPEQGRDRAAGSFLKIILVIFFIGVIGSGIGMYLGLSEKKQPVNGRGNMSYNISTIPTKPAAPSVTTANQPAVSQNVPDKKPSIAVQTGSAPVIGACKVFPADNPWNLDISKLRVHQQSESYMGSIGIDKGLHPDFGGASSGNSWGIPYLTVTNAQKSYPITFTAYGDESDPGPYPIPLTAPVEGGSDSTGDRHVLIVNIDTCKLYELYRAFPTASGWNADSGAVFDLNSNVLRPEHWTSTDAAGLPVFAGLVKYDEVASGSVNHAIRFTTRRTQRAYIHPATHYASSSTDPNLPPMGLRVRLKADYDISKLPPQAKIIAAAMKKYGLILADNGSDWFFQGDVNKNWNDEDINQLKTIKGSAFEAVDTGPLIK